MATLAWEPTLGRPFRILPTLYLPIIALAEACWAIAAGRTSIPDVATLLAAVDGDSRFKIVPLDRAILDRSLTVSAIREMHDRLNCRYRIALGDCLFKCPELTCDSNITGAGLVPILW